MAPPPCPFCALIRGDDAAARIVYQTDAVTAFFPLEPATRGHTLVVPNRHVADLLDLNADEARHLGAATRELGQAVWKAVGADGLNVIQSNGAAATQTVDHLHVHLVPRWPDDRMTLQWPDGAAETETDQDQTLGAVRAQIEHSSHSAVTPEDRRQHLVFIQAVVTRMSQASSSAKTWLLPIVTAAYGYALTKQAPSVALIGLLAVLIFGALDANYLREERAFRRLYDRVAHGGPIPQFAMNPALAAPTTPRTNRNRRHRSNSNLWPGWVNIRSWAIAPIYGPLLVLGVVIDAHLWWC